MTRLGQPFRRLALLAVGVFLVTVVSAFAQDAVKVRWSVIANGGTLNVKHGELRISSTVGQPAVGILKGPQDTKTYVGFWGPFNSGNGKPSSSDEPTLNQDGVLSNFPNPFTTQTTIAFNVPNAGSVNVTVYDLVGRAVKVLINEFKDSGRYEVAWDGKDESGTDLSTGTYIYEMSVSTPAGTVRFRERMMMVR